jgi:hypothetical protein
MGEWARDQNMSHYLLVAARRPAESRQAHRAGQKHW